jgi:hypothetical protein
MHSIRLWMEQLESRTVPSTFDWVGGGADTKWSTLPNWKQDGGDATRKPGADDAVKLPDGGTTVADVGTVSSISVKGNGTATTIKLPGYLSVKNSVSVKNLTLQKNPGATLHAMFIKNRGVFTIDERLDLDNVTLALGSPTERDVTATINSPTSGTGNLIVNSTVQNFGRLTLLGGRWGEEGNTGHITNVTGGTLEIKNRGFDFTGTISNAGTLKFEAAEVSVTPAFSNTGSVRVYPGAVRFFTTAVQYAGSFELRESTVAVSDLTNGLWINDGSLLGDGTIAAKVTLGTAGSATHPVLTPGLSVAGTAFSIGTIAITSDLRILSDGASTKLEVKDGTSVDKVTVTGRATIAGTANVSVSADYQPNFGTQHALVSAAGGLTGTFGTVNFTPAGVSWQDPTGGRNYWQWGYTPTSFMIQVQREQGQQPPPSPPPGPPPPPGP